MIEPMTRRPEPLPTARESWLNVHDVDRDGLLPDSVAKTRTPAVALAPLNVKEQLDIEILDRYYPGPMTEEAAEPRRSGQRRPAPEGTEQPAGIDQEVRPNEEAQQDETDRLIHAWQRELPDVDVSPFAVLSRVSRLARHLDRARRQVFTAHDLESFEFDVLTALRRAGPPYELSPGTLLTQTLVTSGTMTNRIDKLERSGLVERLPSPSDRRGVLVRLTARGQQRVEAALESLLAHERELLAELPEEDRTRLAGLLRGLLLPFEDH